MQKLIIYYSKTPFNSFIANNFQSKIISFILSLLILAIPVQAKNLKVMVFAAHPDDELIGCGGSMRKHINLGNDVRVVYLTSGEAGNLKYSKEKLAGIREKEAENGLGILGVKDFSFLRNKDGYLEANSENLIKMVELIRKYKPDIVYLPHSEEAHQDHRATYDLVTKAINKAKGNWFQEAPGKAWQVKNIFSYEIYPLQKAVNYCEDITTFMNLKDTALKEHKSQIESIAYDDLAKSIGRYRGILSNGTEYAECFQVIRIDDIFH